MNYKTNFLLPNSLNKNQINVKHEKGKVPRAIVNQQRVCLFNNQNMFLKSKTT